MKISRRQFLQLSALSLGVYACLPGKYGWLKDLPGADAGLPAIILGNATVDSITCQALSACDGEAYLEYGAESGKLTRKTETSLLKAGIPSNWQISGLQKNTQTCYRILFRKQSESGFAAGPEHTFMTQRDPGSGYTFTIDADPHFQEPNISLDLYGITLANILKDHPDFHINLGDTFMTEKHKADTREKAEATYREFRPYVETIGADIPYYLVNGNHEGELGWLRNDTAESMAVWCTLFRRMYFPVPEPGAFYSGSTTADPLIGIRDGYYAWTWGDAQFIVLDPFWYTRSKPRPEENGNWVWTLGEEQYRWLKATLETSTAAYKFVFIHHLMGGNSKDARGGIEAAGYYEWGGKNEDGSWGFDTWRPGWGKPIHTLLVENSVSAVFHGHDHVFVHQELDGVIYQECPQPSVVNNKNSGLAAEYGYLHGDVVSSSGHIRVTVSSEFCLVDYVRAYLPKDEKGQQANGDVAFSYQIKKITRG